MCLVSCIRWVTSRLRPLCQWLTAGWDVRGLLFTLMMTHCGTAPLILSPALWIKNSLIDAADIMAVWELAGEKKTRLSRWKGPCLCCWGPSWRKALLSCFQHLTLYNAYYGSLPCTAAIYPLSCAVCLISAAFDQHPQLFKSTARIQIGLVTVMCWNEPSVLITYTMWHGKVEWGSALINNNGW